MTGSCRFPIVRGFADFASPCRLEQINKLKLKDNCRYGRLTWHKQTMQVGHTCPTWAVRQARTNVRRPEVGQVCPTYGHVWASIC
jgi:hypothetical protein